MLSGGVGVLFNGEPSAEGGSFECKKSPCLEQKCERLTNPILKKNETSHLNVASVLCLTLLFVFLYSELVFSVH